ncbi:hypothetical protein HYV12_03500 [Candidatus Dojkabacteria bacterium]|nr:hypothetical protein [Candidatus Dojkabacteria bacterium]
MYSSDFLPFDLPNHVTNIKGLHEQFVKTIEEEASESAQCAIFIRVHRYRDDYQDSLPTIEVRALPQLKDIIIYDELMGVPDSSQKGSFMFTSGHSPMGLHISPRILNDEAKMQFYCRYDSAFSGLHIPVLFPDIPKNMFTPQALHSYLLEKIRDGLIIYQEEIEGKKLTEEERNDIFSAPDFIHHLGSFCHRFIVETSNVEKGIALVDRKISEDTI